MTLEGLAIAFTPCLSGKRQSRNRANISFRGLGLRLQGPFPHACRGKGHYWKWPNTTCPWTGHVFAIVFSYYLSWKKAIMESENMSCSWTWLYSRRPFPPDRPGKGHHGNWANTTCSWPRRASAIDFPPCLSRKMQSLNQISMSSYRHQAIPRGRFCRFQIAFSSCQTRKRLTLHAPSPPAGRGGKASCVQAL